MTRKIKQSGLVMVMTCLVFFISFLSGAYGQEIPEPGTKIDKSNIARYKHLFPEGFDRVFIDGYGLVKPFSITVKKTEPIKWLPEEKAATEKNRGKYKLTADNYVDAPYETIVGLPFPDLDTSDPDFCVKLMHNFGFRYGSDTMNSEMALVMFKRRGEKISLMLPYAKSLGLRGRLFEDPKPYIQNPKGFSGVGINRINYPPINKNIMTLFWSYNDPRLDSTSFGYVPSLRRVLRADTGERSTPRANMTGAPDDTEIFQGRMAEFTFKFLGEQKVLAIAHAKMFPWKLETAIADVKKMTAFPIQTDTWEIRDVYVVEIKSVFPNYPQGKKIIYIDKEYPVALFGNAYDRAMQLWKIWYADKADVKIYSGDTQCRQYGQLGLDIQMGFTDYMVIPAEEVNGFDFQLNEFTTGSLRGMAR